MTDGRNLCLETGAGVFGANDVDKQVVQHKLPVHMYVVCRVYVNIFYFLRHGRDDAFSIISWPIVF